MLFLNATFVFMMCKIILQQQIITFSIDTHTGTLTEPKTETITKQNYRKRHDCMWLEKVPLQLKLNKQSFCSLLAKNMCKSAK